MNVAIIQARMGSSRLPGKVLMDVDGESILGTLIRRLEPSAKLDDSVVATSLSSEDDPIEKWCGDHGVKCFRGSEEDVLDRFYGAAASLPRTPDVIVRICSDNPLHSWKVVDFVVTEFEKAKTDYFSNSNEPPDYLEDGFDVEVFTFKALEQAWNEARLLSEREHVCPYIKKHFKCGWKKAHPEYLFKLSVDTENDLKAVKRIFEELRDVDDFGIEEVVDLLKRRPEILEINRESEINAGYRKSLENDRIVR